jgi:hypothetical protein
MLLLFVVLFRPGIGGKEMIFGFSSFPRLSLSLSLSFDLDHASAACGLSFISINVY